MSSGGGGHRLQIKLQLFVSSIKFAHIFIIATVGGALTCSKALSGAGKHILFVVYFFVAAAITANKNSN